MHTHPCPRPGNLLVLVLFLLSLGFEVRAESVRGVVRDASTKEPIAGALLRLQPSGGEPVELRSGADGAFAAELPPGSISLQATVVGYRPYRVTLTLDAGQPLELELRLVTDTLRRHDQASVVSDAFAREESGAVTLAGNELRNLAGVLADDPLRAVQGLPGVASNDDFQSQFSVRGADFARIGIYLDGVLLRSPFHSLQGEGASPSITAINGDFLDSVALYPSGLDPKLETQIIGTDPRSLQDHCLAGGVHLS